MIDSKGRDFGLFCDGLAETAALKKKSGTKVPHSKRSFLQSEVYQKLQESQGEWVSLNFAAYCHD
jgi:hypothetical protein